MQTLNNKRQKNNYLCGCLGEYATEGRWRIEGIK